MKLPALKPREKFLILEVTPKSASGLFLSVNEERKIVVEKFAGNLNLKKFLKSPAQKISQKAWEGEHLFKKARRKIIVSADPGLATTIPIPLDLPRERELAKREIQLSELENLIAQAMGKIFNQCRHEAARRLAIDELDAILVGAKAKYFRVDGNSVVNPVGFTGKKISLLLELTFTGRELFEVLKPFFNSPDEFFFAESPQARLSSLARAKKLPLNLIVAEPNETSVFVLEKTKDDHPVLYREKLMWHFGSLFERIKEELSLGGNVAAELYRMYLEGKMSEPAARAFKKIIDPVVVELFKEVEKGKIKGFTYVDAAHDLPFPLPHRERGMTFDHLPVTEMLKEFGFAHDMSKLNGEERTVSRYLFPFLEAYFDGSNSDINQKLRRRLHWLLN